jgi:hypothetical protein
MLLAFTTPIILLKCAAAAAGLAPLLVAAIAIYRVRRKAAAFGHRSP